MTAKAPGFTNPNRSDSFSFRRMAMCILGVVISGITVGMFKHAALGIDPFQTLMAGLDAVIPIRFGTLYVIANAVLLLFALCTDRHKIGLGTLVNLFLLGYIAEFTMAVLKRIMPSPGFSARLILLVITIVILCLATSLYFTADLGVSPYDAVALIWSQRQNKIPFFACRVICDFACVLLGTILCRIAGFSLGKITEVVGIGTIITAFFMGPLIDFFNRHISKPLLK